MYQPLGSPKRTDGRPIPARWRPRPRWVLVAIFIVSVLYLLNKPGDGIVDDASFKGQNGLHSEESRHTKPLKRQRPSRSAPKPPPDIVEVNVWPGRTEKPAPVKPGEKFLAYSPHSGYHNQRISLENAFSLAHMLGRTLLLPPVWLGHALPYISYDKLQYRLQTASKFGLDHCKNAGEGGSAQPIPLECEGYFDWTLVHWDFVVDLSKAQQLVPTRDRWNYTQAWLEEELGLRPAGKGKASPDVYTLEDERLYQYRFYDSKDDSTSLEKFENRVDLEDLLEKTNSYKLLSLGSLFGSLRVRATAIDNFKARSAFREAMVFQTPLIDTIVKEVRDRLGGSGNYHGLHLRVGDGVFLEQAPKNMLQVWTTLCQKRMKQNPALCTRIFNQHSVNDKHKRSLEERQDPRPQSNSGYKHPPLPAIPTVRTRADSLLHSSLKCRHPFHTDAEMLPFNAPLFIATDSKIPATDVNLAVFFNAFPCTFILGDFAAVSEFNTVPVADLSKINGVRNEEDKVPLASFLYPQLDAQIASWGRDLIGTPQSTYSSFAVNILHQVYHGWDIIQKG